MCLPVCLCVVIANHDLSNLDKNSLKKPKISDGIIQTFNFRTKIEWIMSKIKKGIQLSCSKYLNL